MKLKTKTVQDEPQVLAVYCGRCRVGYLSERRAGDWRWELCMTSERLRHCPTGTALDVDAALAALERAFNAWCRAAGLEAA